MPNSHLKLNEGDTQGGLTQLSAVLAVDASSVDDPDLVSNRLGDLAGHPFTERSVHFLSLFRGLSRGGHVEMRCWTGRGRG